MAGKAHRPVVSDRPPALTDLVAPERNVVTGRLERADRGDKGRREPDRRLQRGRSPLRSAKVLVPAATGAALLLGAGVMLATQDDGGDRAVGVVTTIEATGTTVGAVPATAPATAPATTTAQADPVCTVASLSGDTTVQPDAATAPAPATSGAQLRPGAVVSTGGDGRAELSTGGGGLARLAGGSAARCVAADQVALTGGRAWSRTRSQPLSVALPGNALVVQPGSAVAVNCARAPGCSVLVLQGSALLTAAGQQLPLTAPEVITVGAGGAPVADSRLPVPFDGAFGDPWLTENASLDATSGLPGAADIFAAHGPAYGSLDGAFVGRRTVLTTICLDTPCDPGVLVGDVAPRTYTFRIDCSAWPCVDQAQIEFALGDEVRTIDVPLTFDGSVHRWRVQVPSYQCAFDDNGDGIRENRLGELQVTVDYTLSARAAEIRDGRYVVTDVSVSSSATNLVTSPYPRCAAFGSNTNTSEFVATR